MMRCLITLLLLLVARPAFADPLAATLRVMIAQPAAADRTDLALHLLTTGHVAIAGRDGERATVSLARSLEEDGGEWGRTLNRLAPATRAVRFYLSEVTGFVHSDDLVSMSPRGRRTDGSYIVVGEKAYPAQIIGIRPLAPQPRQYRLGIRIAEGRTVVASSAADFKAALDILQRPIQSGTLRVVALDGRAGGHLPTAPKIDPSTGASEVDRIGAAPLSLAGGRGQVVIMMGRIETDETGEPVRLVVKSDAGGETGVQLAAIKAAAAAADVTCVVLNTGNATQPGGRNILWMPVQVPGLAAVPQQPTLIDILAFSGGSKPIMLAAEEQDGRLKFEVTPADIAPILNPARWLEGIAGLTLDLLGRSPARSIVVFASTPARQAELDRRIIKWLPSILHYSYGALLLLGLAGFPTAWRWFAGLWPLETPTDYASAFGYHAARVIRTTVFGLVFLPLCALAAAPARLFGFMRRVHKAA